MRSFFGKAVNYDLEMIDLRKALERVTAQRDALQVRVEAAEGLAEAMAAEDRFYDTTRDNESLSVELVGRYWVLVIAKRDQALAAYRATETLEGV